jgi:hypothetical protein
MGYSSPRSKLDRAVVAWLRQKGVCNYIVPAQYSAIIDMGISPVWLVVRSHSGTPETALTNIWSFMVEVSVIGPAVPPPLTENQGQPRVNFDQVFSDMMDALMQTGNNQDLGATADSITQYGRLLKTSADPTQAANNADMGDFTCQAWYPPVSLDGGNPRDEGGARDTTTWKEFATFRAIATPYAVTNDDGS